MSRRIIAVFGLAALVSAFAFAGPPCRLPAAAPPPPGALEAAARATPSAEELARIRREGRAILLRSGVIDPAREPGSPDAEPVNPYRLVQFSVNLSPALRSGLEAGGVRFLDFIPHRSYLVRAEGPALAALESHPLRLWSRPWAGPFKIDPLLLATDWGEVVLEIRLFPDENAFGLLARLQALQPSVVPVTVQGKTAEGVVLRVQVPRGALHPFLETAAEDAAVWSISPWILPSLHNDHSIWVVQSYDTVNKTDYSLSATLWNQGLTGTGQLPALSDSGIDSDMCFFRLSADPAAVTEAQSLPLPQTGTVDPAKKIAAYYVAPGATAYDNNLACNGGSPTSFHGSHTAGSIAGDNYATLSSPAAGGHDNGDGMAPGARLIFQDVGNDETGCLSGTGNDYQLLFQQAYDAGARLHSNSWGAAAAGAYTPSSQALDLFSWRHEDFLFFFSAGNSGPGAGSIGDPATAKNCVTVGALSSGSSGANALASFSSRGPTKDGRRKPDLVAPGSSTNSASGDADHASNNCATKPLSGTSMACPTTAGAATLLRQYFADGFYPTGARNAADALEPSAALLKAALINGAVDIRHPSRAALPGTLDPDNLQGFGRVLLDTVAFFSTPSREARRVRVWDRRHASGLAEGSIEEFPLQVALGQPLKVTLAWTDPPGSTVAAVTLVNNLNLEVIDPQGTVYKGNVWGAGESSPGGYFDELNNVETVYLLNPAAGRYILRVSAPSVPGLPTEAGSDRQGFGLVATHADCQTALAAPGAPAAAAEAGGVRVTWGTVSGATRYQVYRASGDCSVSPGAFSYIGSTDGTTFLDALAQGGFTYAYRVRAATDCAEGPLSPCASLLYTGNCTLAPDFAGLQTAAAQTGEAECAVALTWNPAVSRCPLAPTVVYNVYRGADPYFTPSPFSLIASGLSGSSFVDLNPSPLRTSYYTVRAEDGTTGNGGPHHGGNEERNLSLLAATARAGTSSPGDWTDDADAAAWLDLQSPWRVTRQQNHTAEGRLAYHSAADNAVNPDQTCAAATSPLVLLPAGGAPELSYWVRYNLEYQWDGVVVELSTDDGANWSILTPAEGYPGTLALTGNPPVNQCAYPNTQGAFTGPADNSALTPWARYSHDLSAYAGQTVRVRWRLTTDPAVSFEAFYLDDIRITGASTADACDLHDGQITLDRPSYPCSGGTVVLQVVDTDLRGTGALAVSIASDWETAPETVVLAETPPGSATFTGSIGTTGVPPAADGLVSLRGGDFITATYLDADDGRGGHGVAKQGRAGTDCLGPAITEVTSQVLGAGSVLVRWHTSEPATSRVDYGSTLPFRDTVAQQDSLLTRHSLTLTGLDSCARYFFRVTSVDELGNAGTNDNGGAYFTFTTTGAAPVFGPEEVETGENGWSVAGNWGSEWHRSKCQAASGRWSWQAGRPGCPPAYDPAITTILKSPPIDLGPRGGFDLSYSEWYDTEPSVDLCRVEVSKDGGANWTRLEEYSGSSGGWRRRTVQALRSYTGTVTLRFIFSADAVDQRGGWLLDDIAVTREEPCGPSLRLFANRMIEGCRAGGPGDHDGTIDPGEGVRLIVTARNEGNAPALPATGTLSALSSGVTVTHPTAAFPGLGPGQSAESAPPHFTFRVDPSVAPGTELAFRIDWNAGGVVTQDPLSFKVGRFVPETEITVVEQTFPAAGWPPAWGREAVPPSAAWEIGTTACSAPYAAFLAKNGKPSDAWFFTSALNLRAGVNYSLKYNQRTYGSGGSDNLEIKIGTSPSSSAMTATIWQGNQPQPYCRAYTRPFTVGSDGTYYIGFHGVQPTPRPGVILDDIKVTFIEAAHYEAAPCSGGCTENPDDADILPDAAVYQCAGSPAHLTAWALNGTEPFTYRWMKDGATIDGAAGSSLDPVDTGQHDYTCEIRGSGCSTGSTTKYPTRVVWQDFPRFDGLASVTDAHLDSCGLVLAWNPAAAPCGGPVSYRVYRSTTTPVATTPANRIADGFRGTTFVDALGLVSSQTYYYRVHAVDESRNAEDANSVERSGQATGPYQTQTLLDEPFDSASPPGWSSDAPWVWEAGEGQAAPGCFRSGEMETCCTADLYSPYFQLGHEGRVLFWHREDFTSPRAGYTDDGGFVWIECSGGAGLVKLETEFRTPTGYNALIPADNWTNSYRGSRVFGATTAEWWSSEARLAAYEGLNCRLRFRITCDNTATSRPGWFIDDLRITSQTGGSCSPGSSRPNPKEASPRTGPPMTARRTEDGAVELSFTPGCGATDHAVFWGETSQPGPPQWSSGLCGLGTAGTALFDTADPPAGAVQYFVLVTQNLNFESSYGTASDGTERPEAVALGCDRPQDLSGSCP